MEAGVKLYETKYQSVPTLALIGKDGKKIFFHSLYDPIKEGRDWAEEIYDKQKKIYIVFGGGLFYHIQALMDRMEEDCHVIVVEPDRNVLKLAVDEGALRSVIEDVRFSLLHYEETQRLKDEMFDLLKEINLSDIKLAVFGVYERQYPKEYLDFLNAVKSLMTRLEFYMNTKESFSLEHADNITNNIVHMTDAVFPNEMMDVFKGAAAVIVSAGPSLEKNIDQLRKMEGKVLIISGGRTLKSLLDKGITPHFVVAVDPSYENFELFEEVLDCEVPLLTAWICNKHIIAKYKGEKIFTNCTEIEGLDEELFGRKITELYANGTVATLQLEFARWLGCKNIALIGQDLADTGGKTHADIAAHGKDNAQIWRNDIRIKGNVEEYVYTHRQFKHYIEIFEWYMTQIEEDIQVYNCTEGGAYIEGMKVTTLKDFLKQHAVHERSYKAEIEDLIEQKKDVSNQEKVYSYLCEMSRKVNESKKLAAEARKITDKAVHMQTLSDEDLRRIQKIDHKLQKNEKYLKIANQLSVKTLDDIGKARIDTSKSVEEQYMDTVRLQRALYATIEGTCKAFHQILHEAMMNYKAYWDHKRKRPLEREDVKCR